LKAVSGHGGADPTRLTSASRNVEKLRGLQRLLDRKSLAAELIARSIPIGQYGPGGPQITGFRHFMGPPSPDQSFKIYGLLPYRCPENVDKLRYLMELLATHLAKDFNWPPHSAEDIAKFNPAPERDENPYLPSGYTYLLQLVAHDLVQTSLAISIVEDATTGTRNVRSSALRLTTIYGDGPSACPFAYAIDDEPIYDRTPTRTLLRLGRMKDTGCPFRDIARSTADNETIDLKNQITEPLVADARNDDHAILAQMTALFYHLHNGILSLLPTRDERKMADSPWEAAFDRYLCARDAATLIYRNVVKKDLMKRLLHPDIYRAYAVESPIFLDPESKYPDSLVEFVGPPSGRRSGDWRVPLEFSHAAFRFAHAMVRDRYQINDSANFSIIDALRQNSTLSPNAMPLDHTWIVRWSHFFEIDGTRPNLSRRIGPELSRILLLPDEIDHKKSKYLAYRDLLSSGFVGLWSVNSLIEEIRKKRPEFIELSTLLKDDQERAKAVRDWLGPPKKGGFQQEDIDTLADDTPLYLFVLLEAAHDPKSLGLRLGVLGSIIVAEVVFRALVLDPLPAEVDNCGFHDSLRRLSMSIYGQNYLDEKRIPKIETMADLVKFTAAVAGLEKATPPFL
jgi:hypothetical protein